MQPGSFRPPNDEAWLVRKVQDMERQLNELRAANVFGLTGIRPKDGGTDLDGFVNINGPLEVNGDSEFTGDMKVSGTLDLPAGIIGNAALAAPLEPQAIYSDADGFTLTPAEQDFCVTSFTVPAGYRKAVVVATGTVNTYNTNAAPDYLWARAYINAGFGRRMFALMDANSGPASLTVNKQALMTDLVDGEVITCKLRLASQTANVTSGSNGASMNAFAFFTR